MVSFVTARRSWNFILSGCLKYGLNLRFLPGIAGNSQPFLLGKVPKSVRSYLVIFWSYLVIFGHICGYFWPIWKHEANVSLGKPRNGLRRGLGHLSYIWWVSRIQIFKFSNVTVTFSRNNGYKTVTFFKNFENVHTCCCNPGAREFMVQADKNFQKFSLKSRKFLSLRDALPYKHKA